MSCAGAFMLPRRLRTCRPNFSACTSATPVKLSGAYCPKQAALHACNQQFSQAVINETSVVCGFDVGFFGSGGRRRSQQ
jgi:hypothetical protein